MSPINDNKIRNEASLKINTEQWKDQSVEFSK